jgi:branched-chain amino acid transport system substrate-binding protein
MNRFTRRNILVSGAAAFATPFVGRMARAAPAPIRIGVLGDMVGPYSTFSGINSISATKLALEDFAKLHPDIPVEITSADFQLKPDIGISIVRNWFDTGGVDCVVDIPLSALALGLSERCKESNKVGLFTGTATEDLTGKFCGPNHVHWTYDSYALATTVARALLAKKLDRWFFIAADYAMGATVVRDATAAITQAGGTVVGTVRHPFPSSGDFSSYLLQAQSSGANVLCLANAGDDLANSVKQAKEFGLGGANGPVLTAMLMDVPTVRAIGLEQGQGLFYSNAFYWDMNDGTRAFTKRLLALNNGIYPSQNVAGAYSATLHYLKAVAALGVEKAKADGRAVVAQMKEIPYDDPLFGHGTVRADGRMMNTTYLFQVKRPDQSHAEWDCSIQAGVVPPEQCIRPLAEGACAMVKG